MKELLMKGLRAAMPGLKIAIVAFLGAVLGSIHPGLVEAVLKLIGM